MKEQIKNILLIAFSVFVTLLLVEITLQLNELYSNYIVSKNFLTKREGPTYTILTLGESTTAPWIKNGKDISWPYHLQKHLKETYSAKQRIQVINLGVSAVTSSYLVKNLESKIISNNANMIISMIGINDEVVPIYLQKRGGLKIVKIALLAWDTVTNTAPNPTTLFNRKMLLGCGNPTLDPNWLSDSGVKNIVASNRPNIEDELSTLVKNDPQKKCLVARHLSEVFIQLNGNFVDSPNHPFNLLALKLTKEAFDAGNYTFETIFTQTHLLRIRGEFRKCNVFFKKLLEHNYNIDPSLLADFYDCYKGGSPAYRSDPNVIAYIKHLRVHSVAKGAHITLDNYYKIRALVEKYNLEWIIMQYPLNKIGTLNAFLSPGLPLGNYSSFSHVLNSSILSPKQIPEDFRNYHFIENYNNLNNAVKAHSYEHVFMDRFKITWGHLNSLGNQLIIDNLSNTVRKLIDKEIYKTTSE